MYFTFKRHKQVCRTQVFLIFKDFVTLDPIVSSFMANFKKIFAKSVYLFVNKLYQFAQKIKHPHSSRCITKHRLAIARFMNQRKSIKKDRFQLVQLFLK